MLGDLVGRLFDLIQGTFVTIPLDNPLATVYVVLNTALQLILGLFFGSGDVDILPF